MQPDRPHRRLLAWQESMALATQVYALTASFPADERYSLTAQMKRAAVSVASSIAEGAARGSKKEFAHFLAVSRGSLSELDTQISLAQQLGFATDVQTIEAGLDRVYRLLNGLISSTRAGLGSNYQ